MNTKSITNNICQLHSTVFHRKCLRSILIHSFRKANNISSACINRKMASHNNSICCNIPIFFIHSILPVPSSYLYGGSHRSPENFSHAPLLQRWIVVGILPKSPCASNQQSYIIFSFLLLLFNITKSTHTATHPFAIAQPERYSVVFVCVCVICAMHEFRLARLCRAHSSRNFALWILVCHVYKRLYMMCVCVGEEWHLISPNPKPAQHRW